MPNNGFYQLRFSVLQRDKFTCQYCGQHAPNVILHVDHIVPKSNGGLDTLDNLQTSCAACNLGKNRTSLQETPKPKPPKLSTKRTLLELIRSSLLTFGPNTATNLAKMLKRNRTAISTILSNNDDFVIIKTEGRDKLYTAISETKGEE